MHASQRKAAKQRADRFRIALKRSWERGGHRDKFESTEIDVDTLHARARYDRKGTFYAEIIKRSEDSGRIHYFTLLWSTCGRTDQLDVVENGRILATVRPGLALETVERIVRDSLDCCLTGE